MYLNAGGGGKGTRPNQQHQQQQQHHQQQQTHINLGNHHHHHHPHHHQATHFHQAAATLLHQSTPPPTPPLLQAAAIHLGQQQQQQSTVAPNTSQPPPIAHLHQATHLAGHHTATGHPHLYYQLLAPPPPTVSAVSAQSANNVVQQMTANQNQQQQQKSHVNSVGGGREHNVSHGRHHQQQQQQQQAQHHGGVHNNTNNAGNVATAQHYATAAAAANGGAGPTFMTPTFLQGYQQTAVMATVAAQYNNAASVAAMSQNNAQIYQQGSAAAAAAAAAAGSQTQSHHGQSASAQFSYYQSTMVTGPTTTQLTAGHQQIRGMLPPRPNYVIPTPIFAHRGPLLTSAQQNNSGNNATVPALLQNSVNRQAAGVQTTAYINAFCPQPLAMPNPQPIMAPFAPTYTHMPPTSSYTQQHEKKNRPHAIPIIHPETKQNILDPKPVTEETVDVKNDNLAKNKVEKEEKIDIENKTEAELIAKDAVVKPKEIDKAITVSIAEAPHEVTISSNSSEKIDQQMQTDAVQKNEKLSKTKTTTDDDKSADEYVGNYYTATTTTKERVYDTQVVCEQEENCKSLVDHVQQETVMILEQISDDSITYSSEFGANANYDDLSRDSSVSRKTDDVEGSTFKNSEDKQVQVLMPKVNSSSKLDLTDVNINEPIKYATIVARNPIGASKQQQQQHQTQKMSAATSNIVSEKNKSKTLTPTTSHLMCGPAIDLPLSSTASHATTTTMRKMDDNTYNNGNHTGYLSPVNKNPFKNSNLRHTNMPSGNNYNNNNNMNNNNNNNIASYSNRGNKPQMMNMVLQQKTKNNYVAVSGGCEVVSSSINMATTNTSIVGNTASTSGQMQVGVNNNNKKGRKNKRKDSQKKLKQIEIQNRSRSESLSSTHNNNNNNYNTNNNTTTITNERQYTIYTGSNSATLLRKNNLNNNDNKTTAEIEPATFATTTKVDPYETTTTKTTQQTTDCNLSNHSSHLSLANISSTSEDTFTQKKTSSTTVEVDETHFMPLTVDTKSKQVQICKVTNNNSSSNITSPAKSDKQSDFTERTTDTDSETLTADSPVGYVPSHEIMEQFFNQKSSLNFAKELDEENQISFLNSSLSACEEEDDVNPIKLAHMSEKVPADELLFGDFPKDQPVKKSQSNKNVAEMKKTKDGPTHSSDQHNLKKKVLKYTLQQLRELEKSSQSRKPPMVDCKNRESISHLFVPRQHHHHMTHKHLATQYQHISYNESMEFLSKRRGADGNRNLGMKKHDNLNNPNHARDLSMHQRKLDVIRVQLLLKEEIKLSECENAWQPDYLRQRSPRRASPTVQQQDDLAGVLKKVRGVLNKLTPDNFDVLLKTMSSIIIDTQEKMQQVMLLVFEKTVSEPNFAPTYAKFCKILFQEIKGENRSNFNAALIKRIQHEFETNVNDADAKREKLQPLVDRMETCQDTKERLELQAEIEEREFQFRRRAWGTVRFIGEMYKLQSLTTDRVLLCLESLLQHGCEEKLEYMCKLLNTVGPLLEATKSENIFRLDKIFKRTQEIIKKTHNQKGQYKISSRVRFMMQDVIDLRGRSWDQNMMQQNKGGKHAQRSSYMDSSSQCPSSSNMLDPQRSSYSSQQQQQQQLTHGHQQQRGRFQHKQGGNMPHHMQHGSAQLQQQQQQQDNNAQKQHNIDLTKLRFSAANDNTTLGNKSTYVWNTSTMPSSQCTNNNFNNGPPASVQSTGSANSYQAQRSQNHKSHSKTLPIMSTSCENTRTDRHKKTEFRPKEFLNRLVEELLETNSNWQQEVLQQWSSIDREQQICLIRYLLCDYLHLSEVRRAERQSCSQIFMHLMRACAQYDHTIFTEAYSQFGEVFPDLIVDVPNGWAYVFEFVGPIWQAKLFDFSDIWLKMWMHEEQFTERFVKAMFDYYLAEFGKTYTRSIWQKLFAGEEALAQGNMLHISRWLDYGVKQIDKVCTNIAGTTLSEQQQQQQKRRNINEQLKRIEYLLNITENSELAEDYIATNVHITKNFLRDLTKFVCCEYAITTQMTDKNNAATATATAICVDKQLNKNLNECLFKQKCVPLLRTCLRGYEIKDFGMLDTIVHSLETMNDKITANELVRQIFTALYDCEMISKDAYDNWQQATDTEQSMDDDESCSAGSACDSLTDYLEAKLTGANNEFISSATAAAKQPIIIDNNSVKTATMSTQSQNRGRRRRTKLTRQNVNKSQQHDEVSHSASNSESTSTANSPVHTATPPPTGENTSKTFNKNSSVKSFMERLI